MIPAVALLALGGRRAAPIPIPVFLLWPLIGLAAVLLAIARPFVRTGPGRGASRLDIARAGLLILFQLSGLRIDIRSRDGERVWIRLV